MLHLGSNKFIIIKCRSSCPFYEISFEVLSGQLIKRGRSLR